MERGCKLGLEREDTREKMKKFTKFPFIKENNKNQKKRHL